VRDRSISAGKAPVSSIEAALEALLHAGTHPLVYGKPLAARIAEHETGPCGISNTGPSTAQPSRSSVLRTSSTLDTR